MRLELTRRADYAIRAMLLLGRTVEAPLSGARIAHASEIPPRFLPHVMADLARAGLVVAAIGRRGGYALTDAGRTASVLEVVEAIEGDTRRRTCVLRGGACRNDGACEVHEVFAGAQEALRARLSATTIQELVDPERRPMEGRPLPR
jgi:Rrf2 family protein